MSKFKVGDEVQLLSTSRWANKGTDNPTDTHGVIANIVGRRLPIQVKWGNGTRNSYESTDLELVSSVSVVTPFSELKHWKQEALRMHYAGEPHGAIAEALGKPYFTITTHLRRYKPRYSKEVVDQYYQKPTATELAEASGGTYQTPDTYYKTQQRKKPTIFVIGDLQVKQGVELDYIHHIGAYIAKKQPDIIVQIGDWFDNAALSSYDRGQLSSEGRRLAEDIKAGNEAIRIIDSYITSVSGYNPRKVVTLGNHEDRIQRYVNEQPALAGFLGNHLYHFEQYGWEVYDFLTPCIIEDIAFVHYVVAVNTGKPLGNALAGRLEKVGTSFVMGHQQTFAYHERSLQLTGNMQMALVVGACYSHDEFYKGVQGNHHFRGCVMLYEVQDGYAMHKKITLRHMKELYEGSV